MALKDELVRAYRETLSGLLPSGLAWRRDEASNLQKLLHAYAVELATFDERARILLAESDPRTTRELLDEWERYLGLPNKCTGPLEDLRARQAAIVSKLTRTASASRAFFVEFAAALGYTVQVVEFASARMGGHAADRMTNVGRGARMGGGCGDRLENTFGWAHAWAIRSDGATTSYARMGGQAGDRLRSVGSKLLECSLEDVTPAHTILLFFYFNALDPAPARLSLAAPGKA